MKKPPACALVVTPRREGNRTRHTLPCPAAATTRVSRCRAVHPSDEAHAPPPTLPPPKCRCAPVLPTTPRCPSNTTHRRSPLQYLYIFTIGRTSDGHGVSRRRISHFTGGGHSGPQSSAQPGAPPLQVVCASCTAWRRQHGADLSPVVCYGRGRVGRPQLCGHSDPLRHGGHGFLRHHRRSTQEYDPNC